MTEEVIRTTIRKIARRRGLVAGSVLSLVLLVAAALSFSHVGGSAGALTSAENVVRSPNTPTSGELVEDPKKWDGREITFTGEAITEAMERGENAWIHLNDDAYYLRNVEEGAQLGGYNSGHAVWLPAELTERIEYYGDYGHEGDVVTVRGTFNAACREHGGDMDIHATELTVENPGRPVREPVKPIKVLVAIVLAAGAALLWFANRHAERRELRGLFGH